MIQNPIATIIIPLFNLVDLTNQCFLSIQQNTKDFSLHEIIFVDNASTDETPGFLVKVSNQFSNVKVITNPQNIGFAKAVNQGIKNSRGKYLVLLNNDTIVTQNWLNSLIVEAEISPEIGIVGSRLLYPNSNLIQHIGVKFIKLEDGKYHAFHYGKLRDQRNVPEVLSSKDYNCVTFACALIKREVVEKIGFLDENFINSYEDVDYCIRARLAGYRIRYCASSVIYHFESKTTKRHQFDPENFALLQRKWGSILDRFVDANSLGEIYDVCLREELTFNPRNLYNFITLISVNKKLGNFQEVEELKKEFQISLLKFKTTKPLISIITPVHNNWNLTARFIQTLFFTLEFFDIEIIIIENGSTDSTKENLRLLEEQGLIKVIHNEKNETYSFANNQGAKIARGKFLLFLNNDVFLSPNWGTKLIETFDNDPNIGIQGALLLYPNNLVQHCGIFFSKRGEDVYIHFHRNLGQSIDFPSVQESREVPAVTGAFLAIRKELFEQIGGFDENYIFGHEDIDLCFACQAKGYKVWYNSGIVGYHLESITKKSINLEKFELKIGDPNSIDFRNYQYFHNKWKHIVEKSLS